MGTCQYFIDWTESFCATPELSFLDPQRQHFKQLTISWSLFTSLFPVFRPVSIHPTRKVDLKRLAAASQQFAEVETMGIRAAHPGILWVFQQWETVNVQVLVQEQVCQSHAMRAQQTVQCGEGLPVIVQGKCSSGGRLVTPRQWWWQQGTTVSKWFSMGCSNVIHICKCCHSHSWVPWKSDNFALCPFFTVPWSSYMSTVSRNKYRTILYLEGLNASTSEVLRIQCTRQQKPAQDLWTFIPLSVNRAEGRTPRNVQNTIDVSSRTPATYWTEWAKYLHS